MTLLRDVFLIDTDLLKNANEDTIGKHLTQIVYKVGFCFKGETNCNETSRGEARQTSLLGHA